MKIEEVRQLPVGDSITIQKHGHQIYIERVNEGVISVRINDVDGLSISYIVCPIAFFDTLSKDKESQTTSA